MTAPALDEGRANEFAAFVEQYYSKYIELADTKGGLALTVNAGVLGFLLSLNGYASTIAEQWPLNFAIILFLPLAALFIGAILCANVLRPRGGNSADSPVFWGNVVKGSYQQYVDQVLSADSLEVARWRLAHCYDLAQIADVKYKALWTGLRMTLVAMCLAGVALVRYAVAQG